MVKKLLTPKHILEKKEHKKPYILFLKDFKCYNEILAYRNMVRDLELVPIKSDEIYEKYHLIDTKELLKDIDFSKSSIIFQENKFPYLLPKDVAQYLIWIEKGTPEKDVLKFLQEKIDEYGEDVILFERPLNIKTELVKGSFPHIRHIHFWFKKG
jgi:hypothetical protein